MMQFLATLKEKIFGQSLTDIEKTTPSVLSCLAHLD